jgi:nascent polypeptide-associated complex subunit alpha
MSALNVHVLYPVFCSFQIEDLSSQAQIQAAEKFKAPETVSAAGKETEQEAVVADGDDEDVRRFGGGWVSR